MIFIVYNGWQGNGRVAVIVEADNEDMALRIGRTAFHFEDLLLPEHLRHGEDYCSHLEAEEIKLPYVTEIG